MKGPSFAIAALVLLASPWSWAQAPQRPRQYHAALATIDGVRATLYRYVPAAGPSGRTILLLPDLGTSRHVFDLGGVGLAPFLQAAGWEVYVVEYRGAGRSEVPYGGYRLEDLLEGDAAAAFARAGLEHEKIALGGVGLGATFALVLAARHPERVSSVVALQPLIDPDQSSEPAAALLAQVEKAPAWIDLALLSRAPLFGKRSWFEVLWANDGSFDAEELNRLRLHVLAPVPRDAARQLAEAVRRRRLELGGVSVAGSIRGWQGPALLVFAPRDNLIHPEFATPARDLLSRERCQIHVLAPLSGARRDYGHLGMVLGQNAPGDVFAKVQRFLEEVSQ
ncbi:MAG: alpha/beta fold hydrolase [Deltaproteobacteria bacterium]|nr:alpha/beta fold hydrolase [Deltaproteobacteria bacterium]